MKIILQTLMVALISFAFSSSIVAQTCSPASPPVCVPGNGYAFQYMADTDFGLKFNTGNTSYEFTNGSANAMIGFNALNGDISIPGGGALQVGPNRYAFQYSLDNDYGLFFNAAGLAYEFRTADGSPVLSIGANSGDLTADGNVIGTNLRATGSLDVEGPSAFGGPSLAPSSIYQIRVNSSSTSPGTAYGVFQQTNTTNGYGVRYGYYSDMNNNNTTPDNSRQYGYFSTVDGIGNGNKYGYYASMSGTSTSSSNRYGVFSTISSLGTGTHYGGYFSAVGAGNYAVYGVNSSLSGWAGYFAGRGYFQDNVGIGTTNPTARLHVATGGSEIARFESSTSSKWIAFAEGNVRKGILWNSGNNMILRSDLAGSAVGFQTAGTTRMWINGTGDVGIGTTAPVSRLHIYYPSGVGNGVTMQNSFDSDQWEMYVFSSNDLTLRFNGVQKGAFDDVSGNYTPSSDARYKKNINSLDKKKMMDKIMGLNPSDYHFNEQADNDTRKYYGLIAQEVKEVIPEIAVYFDEEDRYGVSYTELIPILIAGMQEQQTMLTEKDEKVKILESRLDDLEDALTQCCVSHHSENQKSENHNIIKSQDGSWLGQNVPNPFDNSTTIQFYVPQSVSTSSIEVFDLEGRSVKSFSLETGYGEVKFLEGDLSSGTYIYTLINDGVVIATKRMILK